MTDRLPVPTSLRWRKSSYSDNAAGCVELAVLDQASWRKASHSENAAGCVELAILDHSSWRKATYSHNAAGCVELAVVDQAMAVRDSKHPSGPALAFTAPSFHIFLTAARTERLR